MRSLKLSLLLVAVLGLAAPALADTIFVGNLPYKDVKIKTVKDGKLIFMTAGNETSRPVKDITRLQINDEPALSAAEEAYAGQKWEAAVDGYLKTIRSSSKDWLKDWSALRLIEAASKTKRFDAAVTGFLSLMQRDPATAMKLKPEVPQEKSTFLDTAATDVKRVLNETKLNDEQKSTLLAFLLDINRARGDTKAVGETVEQLAKTETSESSTTAGDASASKALADRKLGIANVALEQKDYKKAIDTIEESRGVFTDQRQQADALWILANSRAALAASKNDTKEMQDVALAYMRIVAHFKDAPNAPHVPESLLAAGEILEKLKDTDGATNLYTQLSTAYPETPAGAKAKEGLERLKPKQG
jgi:TolA-binding protein